MRSCSFGGRTLRRVAVLASASVAAVMMVPTAAPAAPSSFTVGQGDCAGVVAWDAVPLLGPAKPIGGSVGDVKNGSVTVVDTGVIDPAIQMLKPGAPLTLAESVIGIVTYPTAQLVTGVPIPGAKDSSIKASVFSSPSVPTHYLGQARWASPQGFGGPKIDVGPMHIGLTPLVGQPIVINDVFEVPNGAALPLRGAMGVSTASAAPPGTVTATYFVWQTTPEAPCTYLAMMCVIVPFNKLGTPPGCPV